MFAKFGAHAKKWMLPHAHRALFAALTAVAAAGARADEPALSPYIPRLTGQENFAYVWTMGIPALGDEQDKLVTIDVNPRSKTHGKVLHALSVGGRNEAHHIDYTDDRRFLWATALDTSRIYILDVHTDPAAPRLHKTLTDFTPSSGGALGPHSAYAIGDRMLVSGLSNETTRDGHTAIVEYTQGGAYVASYRMPDDSDLRGAVKTGQYADGYGYDVQGMLRRNTLFTSSFTGWDNYMADFGTLRADKDAMRRFGNSVVVWNLQQRVPRRILDVPGAPLAIRCALGPRNDHCYTATLLGSKLWLLYVDKTGEWRAKPVASIGTAGKSPMPVDLSLSSDDRLLWVNTWNDGTTRALDVSDPYAPKPVTEQKIGAQLGAIAQSWDGRRVYFTSSFLSHWDKNTAPPGEDLQFFKAYGWDGKKLTQKFSVDFIKEKLGHPRAIRLGG